MNSIAPPLDLAGLAPEEAHSRVLAAFDALAPGEALALTGSHAMRPIVQRLQRDRPRAFEWDLLEAGPQRFRTRLERRTTPGPPDVTAFLRRDHERLDALLACVDSLLGSDLQAARQRFAEFRCGLERHIDMEEKLLFPAFERAAGEAEWGATQTLRQEHEEILEMLATVMRALESGDIVQYATASQTLDLLLGGHNLREESEVYPRADRLLDSTRELAGLLEAMQAF